ncbi:MAG: energy transducer TonB [Candidatus Acidiferrales bacterium]
MLIVTGLLFCPKLPAQQKEAPEVAYAVAPEWPAPDKTEASKPQANAVLVRVTVDGFGNVVERKLLTPKSIYSDSAMQAAFRWKFEPPSTALDENIDGQTVTLKFAFRTLPVKASADELGTAFVTPYEVQLSRRALGR